MQTRRHPTSRSTPGLAWRTKGVVAALLCLGSVMAGGVLAQQPRKNRRQRRLKVAVVDIGLLFKEYKRKDVFEKAINQQREGLKKELEEGHKEVKRLVEEFNHLKLRKGGEAWMREREKVKLAQFQLELKGERMQKGLKSEVEHNTLAILNELEWTIEAYGRKYGYDLILKIDKAGRTAGGNRGELVEHFQERIFRAQISDVLYFNKKRIDITPNVMRFLNHPINLKEMKRRQDEKRRGRAQARRAAKAAGNNKRPK